MKWIGQNIYDQISRFRDDLYLEAVPTSTETDMLVVGSTGLVSKRAIDAITVDVSDFMTNGFDNRIVTATGADAMNAEADLTFSSETLTIGANDNGIAAIERLAHTDDNGGRLHIQSGNGGGTNKAGAELSLRGGQGTGNAVGGSITFKSTAAGSSGTTVRSLVEVAEIDNVGNLQVDGTITTGSTAAMTNAGLLSVAGQTNITSLGTLTALDVDDINLNGKTITVTGDTDDTFTIVTGAAGATTLTTTDDNAAAGHFEIAADGNIILDAAGDIALEAGGADVDITADHVTITSSSASDPTLKLKSTTSDANGCQIQLRNDKGAPGADGDGIGSIRFIGDDAAQTQTEFGKIICQVSEADDSDEAGKMRFMVAESDGTTTALTTGLTIEGEHATDGQIDVTIAAGSASTTTVAGDLSITTGLILDSVDVTTIQTGSESFADNDTSLMTSAAVQDKVQAHYSYQYIPLSMNITGSGAGNWEYASGNGIGNHLYNQDGGAGGTTASNTDGSASTITIDKNQMSGGIIVPYDSVLVGFYAQTRSNDNSARGLGIFTGVPVWNDYEDATVFLRGAVQNDTSAVGGDDHYSIRPFEHSVLDINLALDAGDCLWMAGRDPAGAGGGMIASVTIVLKTLIP